MNFRKSVIAIILAALLLLPLAGFAGDFNYGEALQKAIFFMTPSGQEDSLKGARDPGKTVWSGGAIPHWTIRTEKLT